MWFDVNAALKEALEQYPEEQAGVKNGGSPNAPEGNARLLRKVKVESLKLAGNPNELANEILDMLRGCETLAQASEVVTRHQIEIARIEAAEPARKSHIESYLRYRWLVASSANIGGYTS